MDESIRSVGSRHSSSDSSFSLASNYKTNMKAPRVNNGEGQKEMGRPPVEDAHGTEDLVMASHKGNHVLSLQMGAEAKMDELVVESLELNKDLLDLLQNCSDQSSCGNEGNVYALDWASHIIHGGLIQTLFKDLELNGNTKNLPSSDEIHQMILKVETVIGLLSTSRS
uniref:KIND domain-containing protein n=1 Tax=Rhabditophanes sp. KR3021 TaxID=114890 RepID=A0AC35TZW7_9BILA